MENSIIHKVPMKYQLQRGKINFELFKKTSNNLDTYIAELVSITTKDKGSTWGRTYIQIPPSVLINFGIVSTMPLVTYLNFVSKEPFFYIYLGEIFTGDAAWFDWYSEIDIERLRKDECYLRLKKSLEDKSKDFLEHFDSVAEKWDKLPIENHDLAIIARKLNTHLK